MKKIRNLLIAVIAITSLSTATFAGSFGVGATGSFASIGGEGTESDKDGSTDTSGRTASARNNVMVGSIFAEYTMDSFLGMTLGVDWIPGEADINSSKLSRVDSGSLDSTSDNGTRTANASIENHTTYYAEVPFGGNGVYGKAGFVQMDVTTSETLLNSTVYGNTNVDGVLFGVGYKADLGTSSFYKLEGSHTAFDSLTLNDNVTDKGNKIKADLDVTKITFGLGFKF